MQTETNLLLVCNIKPPIQQAQQKHNAQQKQVRSPFNKKPGGSSVNTIVDFFIEYVKNLSRTFSNVFGPVCAGSSCMQG